MGPRPPARAMAARGFVCGGCGPSVEPGEVGRGSGTGPPAGLGSTASGRAARRRPDPGGLQGPGVEILAAGSRAGLGAGGGASATVGGDGNTGMGPRWRPRCDAQGCVAVAVKGLGGGRALPDAGRGRRRGRVCRPHSLGMSDPQAHACPGTGRSEEEVAAARSQVRAARWVGPPVASGAPAGLLPPWTPRPLVRGGLLQLLASTRSPTLAGASPRDS